MAVAIASSWSMLVVDCPPTEKTEAYVQSTRGTKCFYATGARTYVRLAAALLLVSCCLPAAAAWLLSSQIFSIRFRSRVKTVSHLSTTLRATASSSWYYHALQRPVKVSLFKCTRSTLVVYTQVYFVPLKWFNCELDVEEEKRLSRTGRDVRAWWKGWITFTEQLPFLSTFFIFWPRLPISYVRQAVIKLECACFIAHSNSKAKY